jgi:trimethylamine:corrinoid methyltransferase-like protein
MTFKTVSLLDQDTLQRIQDESLRLLEEVGVYVGDPEAVHALRRAGARVEAHTMLARAHARVEEILDRPLAYGAPADAVGRIQQYLRDRAASLGVAAPDWALV